MDYEPPELDEAVYWCETCDRFTDHQGEWKGLMYCNDCESEYDSDAHLRSIHE